MPNNSVFLVDTYDTLEGVRRAVEVGLKLRERGHELEGIRLDSGDLAYLSVEARRILDAAGFPGAAIVASNDLDEHTIASLKQQGAAIDVWGVGTRLVTGGDQPALGGVYKLGAVRRPGQPWRHRVKVSEQAVKTTTPGVQQVRRFCGPSGFLADVIYDEAMGLPEDVGGGGPARPHPPQAPLRPRARRGPARAGDALRAPGLLAAGRGGGPGARARPGREAARRHQALRQPPPVPGGPRPRAPRAQDPPGAGGEGPRRWSASTSTTTRPRPVAPEVLEAMLPHLREDYGNPSSLHWFGQRARAAVEEARAQVAALVGAEPAEIVFTASGSESDNMALRGVAARAKEPRRKLVCSTIEHHAVLNTAKALREEGCPVELARVAESGVVDLGDLRAKVDEATALVSVMLANNETGSVQPVAEVSRLARGRGALVHCDAVQAAGKVPIDVRALDVDLLTLSAHKLYGPKGVGCLYVRRGTPLAALVRGGGQERNRRAGTENVAGIVGFGAAAALARERLAAEAARVAALRDRLEQRLLAIPGARRNGEGPRLPNTANVSFEGAEAEGLLMALDLAGVAVSTGAACAAGGVEPSHVLRAMGLPPERVQSSLRLSLGRGTTEAQVDRAAAALRDAVGPPARKG